MYLWNAYAGYNYHLTREAMSGEYGVKGNTMVKKNNGNTATNSAFYPMVKFSMPSSNTSGIFMWGGTGTEESSLLDYAIPNKCEYSATAGLSVSSVINGNIVYDETTETFNKTDITVLRNNGTEDITITEIYLVSTSLNSFSSAIVYYKELLTEPITIGAGKYLEISFTSSVLDKSPKVTTTVTE